MLVIVPTRDRPDNAARLCRAFDETVRRPDTHLLLCVDSDDPKLLEYRKIYASRRFDARRVQLAVGARLGLVGTLNRYAAQQATAELHDVIGFMGDDHVPETPDWDVLIHDEIARHAAPRIVYGDDGIQGEALPTAVFMTTNIVTALGYMIPPGLRHLFADNFWRDIGIATNTLSYVSSVKIRHMHPVAGLAEWDEGYRVVNGGEMWTHDQAAYDAYRSVSFADDIDKIEKLKESLR